MVANLNGIVFDQIFGDNSNNRKDEFDTDGDGTATQEDEFVSFTNTGPAAVDISGWQVWSDSCGQGSAPDAAADGHYHTFPSGTVLVPGQTLYVVNEITGPVPHWAQEASQGGVESGAGGHSTNLLTEGSSGDTAESLALVDPASGNFIVFNMAPGDSVFEAFDGGGASAPKWLAGFPGTSMTGEVDGNAVLANMGASTSYQYDPQAGGYAAGDVFVPCFAAGTRIQTADGPMPVEMLCPGDLVETLDNGPVPLRMVLIREVALSGSGDARDLPVQFLPGALGPGMPAAPLTVSPQHRMLVRLADSRAEALAPARGLLHLPGTRLRTDVARVTYVHLVFDRHEVVLAEGALAESFYPGSWSERRLPLRSRLALSDAGLDLSLVAGGPARPLLTVGEARRNIRAPRRAMAAPAAAAL